MSSDLPAFRPDVEPVSGKRQPARQGKEAENKPSKVPPWLAGLASLFIPGLGQALAGAFRRGLLIFMGFFTIVALMAWRFRLTGRLATGVVDIFTTAIRLESLLLILVVLVFILFIWIVVDAYQVAKRSGGNSALLMLMILGLFFGLGWQIGQIDLFALVTRADEAGPALARILWPWERAIDAPEEIRVVSAQIESPCGDPPYPDQEPVEGQPYLLVDPDCGKPSEIGGESGTSFSLTGANFNPDQVVEIWWKDPIGNEFRQRQGGGVVNVHPELDGSFQIDIIMPYRLLPPSAGDAPKIWEIQARQLVSVGEAGPSQELLLVIEEMVETIMIGMMATFFGIIFAIPISFLAARNLMSSSFMTMAVYYLVRTFLNVVRSIEPLIWAIIAIIVVGLGPFAGILALSLHTLASLAKLYSESIESIDPGPIEAIQATGANWVQTIMYAVVPQVIPPFVSFTIYRWDINIRMSTIIGFVGGGGIGFLLAQWIRLLDYSAAGIAVWFIAVTVAILDYVSAEIRARFV